MILQFKHKLLLFVSTCIFIGLLVYGITSGGMVLKMLEGNMRSFLIGKAEENVDRLARLVRQTRADITMLIAHRDIENYMTFRAFEEIDGMTETLSNLELFFKKVQEVHPQYTVIQLVTSDKSPALQINSGVAVQRYESFDPSGALARQSAAFQGPAHQIIRGGEERGRQLLTVAAIKVDKRVEGFLFLLQPINEVIAQIISDLDTGGIEAGLAETSESMIASTGKFGAKDRDGKWLTISRQIPELGWELTVGMPESRSFDFFKILLIVNMLAAAILSGIIFYFVRKAFITLKEYNLILHETVVERTADLEAANKSLLEAKERAEKATELKDKFVSLVSHDLRSPLYSVMGVMDFMTSKYAAGTDSGQREEMLRSAAETLGNLSVMIEKLLDVSRFKTGSIELRKQFVIVRDIVDERNSRVISAYKNKDINVENRLPEDMCVFADPELYGEVIHNLLNNGYKFTEDGGNIIIEPSRSSAGSAVVVRNTGGGVPARFMPNLFKHEVKTSSLGFHGEKGTGLGLPHCHDIIEAHNGSLTVTSEPGQGAEFVVYVPMVEKVILLVGGQPAHQEEIRKMFDKHENISIVEAENALDAVNKLVHMQPHLIITDLQMTGGSGYELLSVLKQSSKYDGIPVIVAASEMTHGYESIDDARVQLMESGASDFVTKPIDEEDFMERVRILLSVQD